MAGFLALVDLALMTVPAGRSAILAYTTPLWVLPGAIFILGERISAAKALALLLGLAGVAIMFNPVAFDWSNGRAIAGNAYLLAGAALWAIAIIHVRKHRWVGSPLTLAPWQMLTGLVPLTILAWLTEGPPPPISSPAGAILLALYSGPLVTGLSVLGCRYGRPHFAGRDGIFDAAAGSGDWFVELGAGSQRAAECGHGHRSFADRQRDCRGEFRQCAGIQGSRPKRAPSAGKAKRCEKNTRQAFFSIRPYFRQNAEAYISHRKTADTSGSPPLPRTERLL